MKILETKRFYLREITVVDAEIAYLLNLDPDVVKYTGDVAFENIEAARQFLEKYDHYKKYGFGRWGVIDKHSGEFTGWCGLKYTPEKKEYDIGFRFFKRFWNKGYATETAAECLAYGFNDLAVPEIVGRAMKENLASIKVLEKIGLTYFDEDKCGGEPGNIYKITKEQYLKLR